MIDKNSQEWKEYTAGLLELDELCGPYFVVPHDPQKDDEYDWVGFFDYIREKYNGDSSTMTQEEKDKFIIKKENRRTA